MEIIENYNLKPHNTFSIDVNADIWVESNCIDEWKDFFLSRNLSPEEIIILGGGSNYLFTQDVKKPILHSSIIGMNVVGMNEDYVLVEVGSGVVWDDFVQWAVDNEYGGVENLSIIPGLVGAAPVQNVGAYGVEAADVIEKVYAIDVITGNDVEIGKENCGFAYRNSNFKGDWKNRYFITKVLFRLTKNHVFKINYGDIKSELSDRKPNLKLIREIITKIRNNKLPDYREIPNAGSFFKNPIVSMKIIEKLRATYKELPVYPINEDMGKISAAWMIDKCGWKGKNLGNAGVYEKQALVLVNRGGANGIDVSYLANEIKKTVFLKFGINLEPEVYIE